MSESEVTFGDQSMINRFARLNAKSEELEIDLKGKKTTLENTCDALSELVLCDEHVLVRAGDVLAVMTSQEAEEWSEELKRKTEEQVSDIERQLSLMKSEMLEIKSKLYAKFGQNINLEYDEEVNDQ